MAQEFKRGDVVRLKSGGPSMTITALGSNPEGKLARVIWFDPNGELRGAQKDAFVLPLEALEYADARAP